MCQAHGQGGFLKMETFFKRGEFAKLNGVSLFALRLYDKMGILKPAYTDPENGYHYYSPLQSQQLMSINLCTKAGFSLKEIQQLPNQGITENALNTFLLQLEANLQENIKTLTASLNMVRSLQYYAEAWQSHGLNHPFLEENITLQGFLSPARPFSLFDYAWDYNYFLRQCESVMGHPAEYPYSFIIKSNGQEQTVQILLRTSEVWKSDNFYRTSSDLKFLILAFQGNYSDVPAALNTLYKYADCNQLHCREFAILTPVQRYLFPHETNSTIFVLGIEVM